MTDLIEPFEFLDFLRRLCVDETKVSIRCGDESAGGIPGRIGEVSNRPRPVSGVIIVVGTDYIQVRPEDGTLIAIPIRAIRNIRIEAKPES